MAQPLKGNPVEVDCLAALICKAEEKASGDDWTFKQRPKLAGFVAPPLAHKIHPLASSVFRIFVIDPTCCQNVDSAAARYESSEASVFFHAECQWRAKVMKFGIRTDKDGPVVYCDSIAGAIVI